jgi:hypothetical protein
MSVASSTRAAPAPAGPATPDSAGRSWHVAALVAVLGLGVLLRGLLIRLPMRYDEAYTWYHYVLPGTDFARNTFDLPNNQILNSVLMNVSWQTFGNTLWSLRLPAFVAGALIPVFSYLAARRIYNRDAALWAAALTAVAGPIVEFSVNGRGYTLGGMFVVVCLWLAARMLDTRGLWEIPAFAVSAGLAVWAVPTMAYGLGAIGVWSGATAALGVRRSAWPLVRLAVAAALAALVGWLLYKPTFGDPAWTFAGLPPTWHSRRDTLKMAWDFWMRTTPFPLPTLFAFAGLASLVLDRRRYGLRVPLCLAIGVVAVIPLFVGQIPPYGRSWFAMLPLCAIAISGVLAILTNVVVSRVGRPALVTAGLPVLIACAMSADLMITGQQGSEEFPSSDNHIVNVVRDQLHAKEVLMDPVSFSVGVTWYFDRFGYTGFRGDVTPAMRKAGYAIVIIPGHDGGLAFATVGARGGTPAPPPMAPQLLRDLEYVSIWRVPLQPAPKKGE